MTDRQIKMLSEIARGFRTAQNGIATVPDKELVAILQKEMEIDFRSLSLNELAQLAVYWNEITRRGLKI